MKNMRHRCADDAVRASELQHAPPDCGHTYDSGITTEAARPEANTASSSAMRNDQSSKHKRKLAAALKKMGTSLATHTESTFKPSGVASKTLEEFKARRAAEKLGLLPKPNTKVIERYEIDADTAQVTKLPLRAKVR